MREREITATRSGNGHDEGIATINDRVLITVYSKPDCHLCAEAMSLLRGLQAELEFELRELDIGTDGALHRAYFERIPVVALDGEELFDYVVDEQEMRERLESRR
jgi:glutaredoxin